MKKFFNFSWLNKNILGFSIASFFSDMAHETAIGLLPAFLMILVGQGGAPQALGIITGISEALATFSKLLFGVMSDRSKARKPFILAGYALEGFFIGMWGFVHSWKTIAWTKSVGWFGKGMREPSRDALIMESTKQEYYGRAFGFHRAFDTLGALIGPLLGFFLLKIVSLRTIFILTFIPSFFSVLAILFLTHDSKNPQQEKGRWWNYILKLPRSFYYFAALIFIFNSAYFNKTFVMLEAQTMLNSSYSFVTASGFVLLLYSFFSAIRFITEYLFGYMSDFMGRKALLGFFGFGLFSFLSLLLALTPASLIFYVFIFGVMALSSAALKTLTKATAADLLHTATPRATGYGLLMMLEGTGNLFANLMIGTLWSRYSAFTAFTYAAFISFSACILLLFMKSNKKG